MAYGTVYKKEIMPMRVKYRDVFHLRNLYITLHEYLQHEEWNGMAGGDPPFEPHSDIETFYLEKVDQKGLHVGGKEMWIWWRLKKKYEGKYNSFIRPRMDIDFRTAYVKDIEVIHQGKKMRIQEGEVEVFIRAWVEADYNNEWENHWFLKRIKKIYLKRLMHQELEKREKELWREAYRFQGIIKNFLNLKQFIPVPVPFHTPVYGWEG